MSRLEITSTDSRASVEFFEVVGESFRIRVRGWDHSAELGVWASTDGPGIARLFEEAARDWKGWRGAKAWESIEHELRLELRIDPLGHVELEVRMRFHPHRGDRWRLDTTLTLDAGQLDSIAAEARTLWPRSQ